MATQYIIVDGDGNQLGGISTSEYEIERIAQRKANDRGESVWYQGDDDSSVEVESSLNAMTPNDAWETYVGSDSAADYTTEVLTAYVSEAPTCDSLTEDGRALLLEKLLAHHERATTAHTGQHTRCGDCQEHRADEAHYSGEMA